MLLYHCAVIMKHFYNKNHIFTIYIDEYNQMNDAPSDVNGIISQPKENIPRVSVISRYTQSLYFFDNKYVLAQVFDKYMPEINKNGVSQVLSEDGKVNIHQVRKIIIFVTLMAKNQLVSVCSTLIKPETS